ncbi:hypothetical protein Dimus_014889 [Dionaea muscipula]
MDAAVAATTKTTITIWGGRHLASSPTTTAATITTTRSIKLSNRRTQYSSITTTTTTTTTTSFSAESCSSINSFLVSQQQRYCSRRISSSIPARRNGGIRRSSQDIHCSMKPGIGSDNATSKNDPEIKLDPNSTVHPPPAPAPERPALSSMNCRGLVLDLGPEYSWDGGEIGSPVVKRYIGDDEERWYMWYHGRPSYGSEEGRRGTTTTTTSIGLAVSSNGICWARGAGPVRSSGDAGLVMSCSNNWWAFDTNGVRPSEMIIMSSSMYSSVYWLYYTGCTDEEVNLPVLPAERGGAENDTKIRRPGAAGPQQPGHSHSQHSHSHRSIGKIYKSLPGLACSQDGRQWARIEGDHHSGALLDVGSATEWDSLFVAAPQVVMHSSDDLRMYYHSYDVEKRRFAIGMARSRDGIRWVKLGKVMESGGGGGDQAGYRFDDLGVMNAHVAQRKDGTYLMAYEGVSAQSGKRSIGLATSEDGLKKWTRIKDEPVLEPSGKDGWDNGGVASACLVQMEGNTEDEWRLYYTGIGQEGRTGIGMAVSNGSDIGHFHRWEGFHL